MPHSPSPASTTEPARPDDARSRNGTPPAPSATPPGNSPSSGTSAAVPAEPARPRPLPFSRYRTPRRAALTIALIYLLIGLAWILLSDLALLAIFGDEALEAWHLQTLKGWFFIGICALILYALIARAARGIVEEQQARRQAAEDFRRIVETAEEGLCILDAAGLITFVNPRLARMVGYEPEDLVGRSVYDFFADAGEAERSRQNQALRRQGQHTRTDFRLRHRDGREVWTYISSSPLFDRGGAFAGALAMITDVTAERRAERAIASLVAGTAGVTGEAFFPELVRHLAEAMGVRFAMVARLDPDGHTVRSLAYWADGALVPDVVYDIRGTPCEQLSTAGDRPLYIPSGLRAQFPDDAFLVEMRAESYAGTLLLDSSGQPVGQLCVLDDEPMPAAPDERLDAMFRVFAARAAAELARLDALAELRRLNEGLERRVDERTAQLQERSAQLQRLNARLQEANEQLSAYTFAVSHDLRVPLRTIRDFASRLLEVTRGQLDEQAQELARRLVGSAHRMEALIADLLEFSRLPRQQVDVSLEPVSLVLLVHDTTGRLSRDPEFERAAFEIKEPLPWVRAHRPSLSLALTNVLTAAVRLVPPDLPPIVFVWSEDRPGNRLRLNVANNGTNRPPAEARRLLELAFDDAPPEPDQLDQSHAGPVADLGPGLALARRSVERMGGAMGWGWVEGYGNALWIDLPEAKGG